MLCYCDKCGGIGDMLESNFSITNCYCCGNSPFKPIPREYIDNYRWRDGNGKQAFTEEVIKKSPNLDPYLFEHCDEIIRNKNKDMEAKMAIGRAYSNEKNCSPKCPTCGSANIKSISGTERAVSVMGLGLFSKKINKSFKCKNCGYTW